MYTVVITPAAQKEIDGLPRVIRARLLEVFARLAAWPAVSGVKALKGDRKGEYRVRTGDYRVVFTVDTVKEVVTVVKVGIRRDVYED